jgi:hypothetical protein
VSCFTILLYEDCNRAIIKKSLNLAVKGYKVIKKRGLVLEVVPCSLEGKGGQASSEDLLSLGYGERDRVRVKFIN